MGKYPGEYDAVCALFEAGPDAYAAKAADVEEALGPDDDDRPF